MIHRLPAALEDLVRQIARLPGLGPKSALRVAMKLLAWPESQTRHLGESILSLPDRLKLCSRCGALGDADICAVCADPERDESLLCLVSEWDSMLTLEDCGFFRGRYLILGDLAAPQDIQEGDLDMERLARRLEEGQTKEIILAFGSTIEAENTAAYICGFVRRHFPEIRLTRLAHGIPLGAEVKFMDRETLRQSLQYRQEAE